jgi:hypothetical protein
LLWLLPKPLYHSWSMCQYNDIDCVLWHWGTPGAGFQIHVLTPSMQPLLSNLKSCIPKSKTNVSVKLLSASSCYMTISVFIWPNWMPYNGKWSNIVHTAMWFLHVWT